MRLVDADLLVYAFVQSMPQHDRAREWLDDTINGVAKVGLPWQSLLAFVRLVCNPRIFEHPTSLAEAWEQAEEWLDCDTVWVPAPTGRHTEVLSSLLAQPGLGANHVPDAHLAAIAITHGLMLSTTDRGFQRFPGLKVENPLASAEA